MNINALGSISDSDMVFAKPMLRQYWCQWKGTVCVVWHCPVWTMAHIHNVSQSSSSDLGFSWTFLDHNEYDQMDRLDPTLMGFVNTAL